MSTTNEDCDCEYHSGGCVISEAPPEGWKCHCQYKVSTGLERCHTNLYLILMSYFGMFREPGLVEPMLSSVTLMRCAQGSATLMSAARRGEGIVGATREPWLMGITNCKE